MEDMPWEFYNGSFSIYVDKIREDDLLRTVLINLKKFTILHGSKSLKNINKIYINANDSTITIEATLTKPLLDYVTILRKLEEIAIKTSNNITDQIKKELIEILNIHNGLIYKNPYLALTQLNKISQKSKLAKKCSKLLKKCKLVREWDSWARDFYQLINNLKIEKEKISEINSEKSVVSYTLDEYSVGPFIVHVIDNELQDEYLYRVDLKEEVLNILPFVREKNLISLILSRLDEGILHGLNIEEILKKIENVARLELQINLNIKGAALDEVASYLAFKIINLDKLAPFLLDEHVEEIYVDSPYSEVYLDHNKWGRCTSNVRLSEQDVMAFLTHIRVETGQDLTYSKPSLKAEITGNRLRLRVSIDAPPLAKDGIALDIRKFRTRPYTILELINLGTLSVEAAAFLLCMLRHRRNILIIGEPGSGKTTLLNALDLCTPKSWRKIYIEDVVESIPQIEYGRHQLRIKVPTYEEELGALHEVNTNKSIEVIKLLHRSPDYIILGEIQTKEHTKAFFHALATGLKAIATCHASSPEGLILRWIKHYGIEDTNLSLIDIIVLMNKTRGLGRRLRRVIKICELSPTTKTTLPIQTSNLPEIKVIFSLVNEKLLPLTDMQEISVLDRIAQEEGYTVDNLLSEIDVYINLLYHLLSFQIYDFKEIIRIFNKLHRHLDKKEFSLDWLREGVFFEKVRETI